MKLATRLAVLLSLCALPALPALANEGPRFGLQGGFADPQGDLRTIADSKLGFTAGMHMTLDLGTGWMLRPRLDYLALPERTESDSYYDPYLEATFQDSVSARISGWSLGVDALYFPGGRPQGLYLVGGLGLVAWKVEASASASVTGPGGSESSVSSDSKTWNKTAFAVGLGYQFNRSFALEGRYVASKIGDTDASANMLQAVVTFRF